jgi:Zn-dependent M28 family amino/carboxypeptidase
MSRRPSARHVGAGLVTAGGLLAASLVATPAGAVPDQAGCDNRNNNTFEKLLECVRLEGVRAHQAALQEIADENGGTRADQTPGYTASVDYVVEVMKAAGWDVERVPFTYTTADVVLEQLTPTAATFPANPAVGTGEGDVTAAVVPVDINLTGDRANTSGCEAADFAAFPAGSIALVQRGTCTFAQKALNAEAADASGVVIFNQGDSVGPGDRLGPLFPTLAPSSVDIPVVGTSFDAGVSLAQVGSTARLSVDFFDVESENVIAELRGANENNVVMAGAHLDSVPAGPGIQDNGTGSAALLEIGEQLSKFRPQNTVRFAWWGAEELGLIGSTEWVSNLSQDELDRIALYLNFDMIGSPNYFFGVYDANQSSFPAPPGVPIPPGSEELERTFELFYTLRGEPYDDSEFSGRSDYQAFILNGIPSSGLFTGAEVRKTEEQAAIWGGTVGDQFDPCYHLACDTYDNISLHALDVNSDAVAFAVLTYAYSTQAVNGVPGKRVPGNFRIPAEPAGPEHTFAGPLGGEGPHDHDHDHEEVAS